MGITFSRQQRFKEALAQLDLVDDADLQLRAHSARLEILNEQGLYEEAIRLGDDVLEQTGSGRNEEFRSAVQVEVGYACWNGRKDRERAMQLAVASLAHGQTSDVALWLVREIDGQFSPTAKYYRILVEGMKTEAGDRRKRRGFFVSYDIVADSIDESLSFIRRIEGEEVRSSFRVEEATELESRPAEPKGVYARTGRILFTPDRAARRGQRRVVRRPR
jgi:hypothetical protein